MVNTRAIVSIAAIAAIAAAAAVVLGMHPSPAAGQGSTAVSAGAHGGNATQAGNQSGVLFASTQYAPYSYQVYPGPLSQQARAALSGFNVTTAALRNSSVEITVTLLGSGQQQSMTLKPGYRLYVVEAAFGDDSFHSDYSLGDDGFVIVDQNGYVA